MTKNIHLYKSSRTKHLLVACFLFLFPGKLLAQLTEKNNTRTDLIIYRVFDSLDDYLGREIASHYPKDTVQAIIIDPVCRLKRSIILGRNGGPIENMIYFSVLYKSLRYHDTIIDKTNRYISIGGNLYPVYIFYVDNILTEGRELANRVCSDGEVGVDWHLHDTHNFGVVADMARKQYYIQTGFTDWTNPRGVKKK